MSGAGDYCIRHKWLPGSLWACLVAVEFSFIIIRFGYTKKNIYIIEIIER